MDKIILTMKLLEEKLHENGYIINNIVNKTIQHLFIYLLKNNQILLSGAKPLIQQLELKKQCGLIKQIQNLSQSLKK